jgi:hypothetical protein
MILGVRARLPLSGITSQTRQSHRTPEPCEKPRLSDRATITTAGLFGFVIIRVLSVAHGDVPVALAIISAVGAVTVVVNTIVASIDIILFFLLFVLWSLLGRSTEAFWRNLLMIALLLVLTALFLIANLGLLLVGLGIIVFSILIQIRGRRGSSGSNIMPSEQGIDRSFVIITTVAIIFSLIFGPVWLPAEVVKLDCGNQIIGYVLDDQGDWYSILKDNPRAVLRIEKSRLKERNVCLTENQSDSANGTGLRIVEHLIGHRTPLPEPSCTKS